MKAERLPGTDFYVVRSQQRSVECVAKQQAFLDAYEKLGNICRAAKVAKIDDRRHWEWLHTDLEYAAEFRKRRQVAIGRLKDEAHRRAVEGVLKPVFQHGRQVGTIREYSDNLLMFLLKGACPEEYRDNYKPEPKQIEFVDPDFAKLTTEEVEFLHAIALKISQPAGDAARLSAPDPDQDPDVFQ